MHQNGFFYPHLHLRMLSEIFQSRFRSGLQMSTWLYTWRYCYCLFHCYFMLFHVSSLTQGLTHGTIPTIQQCVWEIESTAAVDSLSRSALCLRNTPPVKLLSDVSAFMTIWSYIKTCGWRLHAEKMKIEFQNMKYNIQYNIYNIYII